MLCSSMGKRKKMSKLNMAGGGAGATTSEFSRSAFPYFSFFLFNMNEILIVLFEILPKKLPRLAFVIEDSVPFFRSVSAPHFARTVSRFVTLHFFQKGSRIPASGSEFFHSGSAILSTVSVWSRLWEYLKIHFTYHNGRNCKTLVF